MTELTIFTAPKPFTDAHIAVLQRNAIRSWQALGNKVVVVLVGDEPGIAETARKLNVQHLPKVTKNHQGTPLISSIFELGRSVNRSPLLAYVNADIILFPDFLDSALKVQEKLDKFLLVGQRYDLEVKQELVFRKGWQVDLERAITEKGRLHPPMGSDYFIFPRTCFEQIPNFAIGRAGWDNWMIFKARWERWKVIDCTGSIHIVHQDHDYSHLPGGQPHYRLPESFENVRLAGGKRTIYHLIDVNATWRNGHVSKPKLTWQKFWREVETFPLNNIHNFALAQITYALCHPIRALRDIRNWLRNNFKGESRNGKYSPVKPTRVVESHTDRKRGRDH